MKDLTAKQHINADSSIHDKMQLDKLFQNNIFFSFLVHIIFRDELKTYFYHL